MHDAIVLGLGAMGASASYQLARRGADVLGIDRFSPPHIHGSSHGATRITRLAVGEGEQYVPLAKRSHEIWREIEAATGAELFVQNGGLIISSAASKATTHVADFFGKTVNAARAHAIAHQMLDAAAIRARFPQFRVHDREMGYFEPSAGFVRPEAAIAAQISLAENHGAEIRTGESVVDVAVLPDGVKVTTDRGNYRARKLVVAAGAWLPRLLDARFAKLLKVYRQTLFWFSLEDAALYSPERFPIFIWDPVGRTQPIYGFPAIDGTGVKIATEQYENVCDPDSVAVAASSAETAAMHRDFVAPQFHGLGACVDTATCLYTVTPDSHFIIDTPPGMARVLVVSACSGHGFKHSPAIGEAAAAWAMDAPPPFDLSAFRLSRFG